MTGSIGLKRSDGALVCRIYKSLCALLATLGLAGCSAGSGDDSSADADSKAVGTLLFEPELNLIGYWAFDTQEPTPW